MSAKCAAKNTYMFVLSSVVHRRCGGCVVMGSGTQVQVSVA